MKYRLSASTDSHWAFDPYYFNSVAKLSAIKSPETDRIHYFQRYLPYSHMFSRVLIFAIEKKFGKLSTQNLVPCYKKEHWHFNVCKEVLFKITGAVFLKRASSHNLKTTLLNWALFVWSILLIVLCLRLMLSQLNPLLIVSDWFFKMVIYKIWWYFPTVKYPLNQFPWNHEN